MKGTRMHTVSLTQPVILDSSTPGTSVSLAIVVENATQPPNTQPGTISVDFNGETATADFNVTINDTVKPSATVVMTSAPNLDVTVGNAVLSAGTTDRWQIPVTFTVT